MMADAFKDLFYILHESIVKNWFAELDMPKVTLTLSCLATCLTFLIHRADTKP